jgi:hypothetical protein
VALDRDNADLQRQYEGVRQEVKDRRAEAEVARIKEKAAEVRTGACE